MYLNIHTILCLTCTLPVTTCECAQDISKIKHGSRQIEWTGSSAHSLWNGDRLRTSDNYVCQKTTMQNDATRLLPSGLTSHKSQLSYYPDCYSYYYYFFLIFIIIISQKNIGSVGRQKKLGREEQSKNKIK